MATVPVLATGGYSPSGSHWWPQSEAQSATVAVWPGRHRHQLPLATLHTVAARGGTRWHVCVTWPSLGQSQSLSGDDATNNAQDGWQEPSRPSLCT